MWYWQDYSNYAPKELKTCGSFLEALRRAVLERYLFLQNIAGLEDAPQNIQTSFLSETLNFEAIDWLQTVLIDNIAYFQSGHTSDAYNTVEENQEIFSIAKLMTRLRVYENYYSLPSGSLGDEIFLLKRNSVISRQWLMQKYHIINILNSFRTEFAWGSKTAWTLQSYSEGSSSMIRFENRTCYQTQCELIVEPYESWHDGPQRLSLWPWSYGNDTKTYSFSSTEPVSFVPLAGKLMPLFDCCRYWWPWGSWYVNPT